MDDTALITAIFYWAMDLLRQGCFTSLHVLRMAEEIAIQCEDADTLRWLEQREAEERQRLYRP